jgi:hypothetical protein
VHALALGEQHRAGKWTRTGKDLKAKRGSVQITAARNEVVGSRAHHSDAVTILQNLKDDY